LNFNLDTKIFSQIYLIKNVQNEKIIILFEKNELLVLTQSAIFYCYKK